jgi:hypothetical protein
LHQAGNVLDQEDQGVAEESCAEKSRFRSFFWRFWDDHARSDLGRLFFE